MCATSYTSINLEVYQLSRGLVERVPGRLVLGDVPRDKVGAVGQVRKLAVGGSGLLVGAVLDQQLEDLTRQCQILLCKLQRGIMQPIIRQGECHAF